MTLKLMKMKISYRKENRELETIDVKFIDMVKIFVLVNIIGLIFIWLLIMIIFVIFGIFIGIGSILV